MSDPYRPKFDPEEPFRHDVASVKRQALWLSNDEAYGLLEVCKSVKGLDDAALARLAGNANHDEMTALLPAFAQLQAFLEANGWSFP